MPKLSFTTDKIEITTNKKTSAKGILASTDTDATYPSSKAVYNSIKDLENTSNKRTVLTESDTDSTYPSSKAVYNSIKNLESTSNKRTTLSESDTDATYPSSKAVYDSIKNVENKLDIATNAHGAYVAWENTWVDKTTGITWYARQWNNSKDFDFVNGLIECWATLDANTIDSESQVAWGSSTIKAVERSLDFPYGGFFGDTPPKVYCSVSGALAFCVDNKTNTDTCKVKVFGPGASNCDVNVYCIGNFSSIN